MLTAKDYLIRKKILVARCHKVGQGGGPFATTEKIGKPCVAAQGQCCLLGMSLDSHRRRNDAGNRTVCRGGAPATAPATTSSAT